MDGGEEKVVISRILDLNLFLTWCFGEKNIFNMTLSRVEEDGKIGPSYLQEGVTS